MKLYRRISVVRLGSRYLFSFNLNSTEINQSFLKSSILVIKVQINVSFGWKLNNYYLLILLPITFHSHRSQECQDNNHHRKRLKRSNAERSLKKYAAIIIIEIEKIINKGLYIIFKWKFNYEIVLLIKYDFYNYYFNYYYIIWIYCRHLLFFFHCSKTNR